MPSAWLVIRATVAQAADRSGFDAWYHAEHLPDAMKAFGVSTAWRGWSAQDPSVHCAQYLFESADRLDAITRGPEIAALIAEFDRCWPQVTRVREILVVEDAVGLG